MPKENDNRKKSSPSIEEIENKLKDALARKEEEIEKELEEKVRQKEEEEERKEFEPAQKEEFLTNFGTLISEYESNWTSLKSDLEEFLNKANQFQEEFENITGRTLEELRKVSELSQRLEELNQDVNSKISLIKKKLEDKFGALDEAPEGAEREEMGMDFRQDTEEAKKIEDVLREAEGVKAEEEEFLIEEEAKEDVPPFPEPVEETVEIKEEEKTEENEVTFETEEKSEEIETPLSEKEMEEVLEEKPLEEEKVEEEVSSLEAMDDTTKTTAVEAPEEEPEHEEKVEEEISSLEAMDETIRVKAEDFMKDELPKEEEEVKEEETEEEELREEAEKEVSSLEAMDDTTKTEAVEAHEEEPASEEGVEDEVSMLEAMDETIRIKAEDLMKGKLPIGIEEAEKEEEGKKEVSSLEAMDETTGTMVAEPQEEKPVTKEKQEVEIREDEAGSKEVYEALKDYRKTDLPDDENGVVYYENNEKIVLDSECLIFALSRHLEEGKKLYSKLSQTESPKDQFFVKQEIIRHQEALRDIFLRSTKMLEQDSCSLPQFTMEIVNKDMIKEINEKLSMENWSNQDDFTFFEEYVNEIRNSFYAQMTPRDGYIESIKDKLGIS